MRTLNEVEPDAPAETVLTPLQLRIVRSKAKDPFPQHATLADALFAIGRLGGFLKHDKRPGWQVLAQASKTCSSWNRARPLSVKPVVINDQSRAS